MGQKVNPIGMRLGIVRTWDSLWFEGKQYKDKLHEDLRIRAVIDELSRSAGVSRVQIERRANQVRVVINTAKPGIIIGKRGAGIEDLRKKLERVVGKPVNVNVIEIKHPELDAKLVGNNIIDQLEKRIAFRRAMRQAIQRTMKAGARGIKVQCGGRLGGAEIARVERNFEGKVPLHTLRANIDYAQVEAYTTYGRIGVKVWIYLGEVLPDGRPKQEQDLRPRERRPRRPKTETPAEGAPAIAGAAPVTTEAAVGAPPAETPAAPAEGATPVTTEAAVDTATPPVEAAKPEGT
jgi:small subunit ribosomal protein S3